MSVALFLSTAIRVARFALEPQAEEYVRLLVANLIFGGYFAALERLDASLLSLLLYTYPAFVTLAAIALGRMYARLYRLQLQQHDS